MASRQHDYFWLWASFFLAGVSCGASDDAVKGEGSFEAAGEPTESSEGLYGARHEGQYHLGPVDFAETEWSNACAPAGGYLKSLRGDTGLGGEFLAGVSGSFNEGGGICDSCIEINTEAGRSVVARVVTYGATNEPGDIDVSPSVYTALNLDEYPRMMTWQLAKCPSFGDIVYEFQTGANAWWTSLWVRNQRVPLERVEVKSSRHSEFFQLRRESDGTLNDDGGFGEGEFTLRLTAIDGQVITQEFSDFEGGERVVSQKQFE